MRGKKKEDPAHTRIFMGFLYSIMAGYLGLLVWVMRGRGGRRIVLECGVYDGKMRGKGGCTLYWWRYAAMVLEVWSGGKVLESRYG